jgi:uncharacterized membrane protein YqhA
MGFSQSVLKIKISLQIVTISGISFGLKAQLNPAQGNALG